MRNHEFTSAAESVVGDTTSHDKPQFTQASPSTYRVVQHGGDAVTALVGLNVQNVGPEFKEDVPSVYDRMRIMSKPGTVNRGR